jgi:hypothetical protein
MYLLNSFVPSQVLQTGLEINEVDNSGFSTQGPTVYAGNLGYNKYIIQVNHRKKYILCLLQAESPYCSYYLLTVL